MNKLILLFICFLAAALCSNAQELNCEVEVVAQQVGSDQTIYKNMKKAINNLMNNTKWTEKEFEVNEKIDCSLFLNITQKQGENNFIAELQIQSRRPIYNSSYNSNTLLIKDNNIIFTFDQFDPLQYAENSYTDELTAVLSFYAYYIIGTDFDTFSLNGGDPFFRKALDIVNLAASKNTSSGWNAAKQDNRYWMINNILDPFFQPLRDCSYEYHIKGFDIMTQDLTKARLAINKGLKKIETIHKTKPNNYSTQLFFYAKVDELVNLYKTAKGSEKMEMVAYLRKVNTANNVRYNKILK